MANNELDLSKIEGFDWDEGNIDKSWKKHEVHYKEAEEVFQNLPRVLLIDEKHSITEKRFIIWGRTDKNRNLAVVFTIRNKKIRVISVRDMNKKERSEYEKKTKKNTTI
ncbi:hypothetical protein A2767_03305 [Candidatus Roizmanbacteria bacterium RIFCSPHIGHO2_01_FULL_35_10]|uniref:Toxin n=1 Tax=Candidatus Roizmanbacteria bacterium RIFCSPLOWO2_01_FULL_35_13 TaxID=1802055 RepID=A0A1F7I8M3_9BACT|nr:MAG: hypothetical protein A2767_03305 [Candidatus Roizmanbacteria bacterium RIFCSPHIGHO2_01_FULL_35_10]OGK39704.1 MAG: hypothetical protein A3A74_04375 [Candidatus Roizmanbacteria bacterium RIFCSPLOWO2_01_FULL_35_13]